MPQDISHGGVFTITKAELRALLKRPLSASDKTIQAQTKLSI
jgi:hypothetical protein